MALSLAALAWEMTCLRANVSFRRDSQNPLMVDNLSVRIISQISLDPLFQV